MKRIFACFIFVIIFSAGAKSQINRDSVCYTPDLFFHHTEDFFTAPFHYGNGEYLDLLKAASLTGFSFFADKEIKSYSQDGKHRPEMLGKILSIDTYYGNTKSAVVILGSTMLVGIVAGENRVLKAGIMMTESVLFSNIITQSVKMLAGRERPELTDNNLHFIGPNLGLDKFHSIPSGHATTAFAISTVAAGLTDNTYLKVLYYTPAFLTSFARVYNNRHWLSDVMLGSLIGYFTGEKVLQMNGETAKTKSINLNMGLNYINLCIDF